MLPTYEIFNILSDQLVLTDILLKYIVSNSQKNCQIKIPRIINSKINVH